MKLLNNFKKLTHLIIAGNLSIHRKCVLFLYSSSSTPPLHAVKPLNLNEWNHFLFKTTGTRWFIADSLHTFTCSVRRNLHCPYIPLLLFGGKCSQEMFHPTSHDTYIGVNTFKRFYCNDEIYDLTFLYTFAVKLIATD